MENSNVCPSSQAEECTAYLPCRTAYLSGLGHGEINPMDPEDAFDKREDIVQAVRYLLAAKSVTGHTLVVDGGQHLWPLQRDVQFEVS